jgi:hypothetical protein
MTEPTEPLEPNDIPIACALADPDKAKRLAALEQEIFFAVLETRELADGYAFRFPSDTAWLVNLAAFIAEERMCCPFFTFELVVEPGHGPLWLRLRGREGVKRFIEQQFMHPRPDIE